MSMARLISLKEELHDLEEKATTEHKGQDAFECVSTRYSITFHVSNEDVPIQNLLMGDF
jgi:hypothetical protein